MARPLYEIARDIRANWKKVNYAAAPYLSAMASLNSVEDEYGYGSSGRSVVAYFLANAGGFRGEAARALKAELREAIK